MVLVPFVTHPANFQLVLRASFCSHVVHQSEALHAGAIFDPGSVWNFREIFHCKVASKLRFRTDPDLPGVERLAVTTPDSAFLESKYVALPELPNSGLVLSFLALIMTTSQINFRIVCALCGLKISVRHPIGPFLCWLCERLAPKRDLLDCCRSGQMP